MPVPLQRDLILASSSPRRAQILRMLGFEFEVRAVPVSEEIHGDPAPEAHVRDLALQKAEAGRDGRNRGVLIGADTVVVLDGDILTKPGSPDGALAMLRRLRGRWHAVYTGVALVDAGSGRSAATVERTEVCFRDWDDDFLRRYVATGECMDKAGAYAIQGLGALLVRDIRGCYYNVMGFPIHGFVDLLMRLGAAEDVRAS